jgi:DNA-binding XRE family transcriptional regulator
MFLLPTFPVVFFVSQDVPDHDPLGCVVDDSQQSVLVSLDAKNRNNHAARESNAIRRRKLFANVLKYPPCGGRRDIDPIGQPFPGVPVPSDKTLDCGEVDLKAMLLGEVRKQLGPTQVKVARAMGVSQSALSQLESQDDLQLSTLRRLANALGGELDVRARFGERLTVLTSSTRRPLPGKI